MRIDLPQCSFKLCRKCFDGNCTGNENNRLDCEIFRNNFDAENFEKEIFEWHETIKEDLKKDKYNMNLLCVDAVLSSVKDIIYDNTLFVE